MKIRPIQAFVAVALAISATSVADVSVEPIGMKIVWKSLRKEFDGFQTFNASEGAYVALGVMAGEKGIIAFDEDKSKISLSDGKKDLDAGFGMGDRISKDAKALRLEVKTKKVPAPGSTELVLKGNLSVTVASETETKATEVRKFDKGDKVQLADGFEFQVERIGKPKWGDDPLEVTLEWKRKIPELAAIRFFDADGKEIESSRGSSSRSGFFGKYTVTRTYLLKKKSDNLKIEVDLWTNAENITVPVDLKVQIGGAG